MCASPTSFSDDIDDPDYVDVGNDSDSDDIYNEDDTSLVQGGAGSGDGGIGVVDKSRVL